MTRWGGHRPVNVGLAVAFVGAASWLLGCGTSAADLCAEACDCTGCSDNELDECIDNAEDAEKKAEDQGCEDQYDEYMDCIDSELECRDGKVDIDGCESEVSALGKCALVAVDPGANVCEAATQLCGSSGEPPECSGQFECFSQCVVAAGNCTAETLTSCSESCQP